mmetsp:Transcript_59908/g.140136  ORF Transcript_59908/g.140136 Transcript_59908/m.140136 type:complete len:252 (+) Transcript_59908:205-960(+)
MCHLPDASRRRQISILVTSDSKRMQGYLVVHPVTECLCIKEKVHILLGKSRVASDDGVPDGFLQGFHLSAKGAAQGPQVQTHSRGHANTQDAVHRMVHRVIKHQILEPGDVAAEADHASDVRQQSCKAAIFGNTVQHVAVVLHDSTVLRAVDIVGVTFRGEVAGSSTHRLPVVIHPKQLLLEQALPDIVELQLLRLEGLVAARRLLVVSWTELQVLLDRWVRIQGLDVDLGSPVDRKQRILTRWFVCKCQR